MTRASSDTALTAIWIVFTLTASLANATVNAHSDSSRSPNAIAFKAYHDGGIRDLDDIGNRNIGCGRGLGNWYTIDKQLAVGRSFAQQVESTIRLVKDPVITEYINRVGQNLVRNSDSQVPFTIKVIDSDDINAFALPGGFFYVDTGLILAADSEAELARVMAHEIAHVAAVDCYKVSVANPRFGPSAPSVNAKSEHVGVGSAVGKVLTVGGFSPIELRGKVRIILLTARFPRICVREHS